MKDKTSKVKYFVSQIVLSKVDTLRLTPGVLLQLRNGECNGENNEKSSDSHLNDPYSPMEELHVTAKTKGITQKSEQVNFSVVQEKERKIDTVPIRKLYFQNYSIYNISTLEKKLEPSK